MYASRRTGLSIWQGRVLREDCVHFSIASQSSYSAVIFATSRNRPRLSALHLRDTASILSPEWKHLAPCLGAALVASPVAGNLTRIGELVHPQAPKFYSASPFSMELFQASRLASHLFFQLIRESPLHVSRSRSLPAAYLTPSIMGTLLGLSSSRESNRPEFIRKVLRDLHGIKSNYINEAHWTGVSLARWMDLMPIGARSLKPNNRIPSPDLPLVSSLWLMAVWELCDTKSDFLDFLISAEQILPDNEPRILDPTNQLTQAILHDQSAREEWSNGQFDKSIDLSPCQVEGAFDWLQWTNESDTGGSQSTVCSNSLETVCAAASLNHLPLHSKPACPTGYYGFDGGGIQADCAELTVREVINLLLWDETAGNFDVRRLPATASAKLVELYNESIQTFNESGDAWFHFLSDLPGCDYLAKSPNGRSYELAPTISNVVRAVQILLLGQSRRRVAPEWRDFKDLADFWQDNPLDVFESTLTHRSSTTGELLHHEFATLRLRGSPYGMELRLRCDWTKLSGMSKVTHLRDRGSLVNKDHLERFLAPNAPAAVKTLGLALGGHAPLTTNSVEDPVAKMAHMLGTPFGCDRRWLLTSDLKEELRIRALRENESVLKLAILVACGVAKTDELVAATLLPWLLNETPSVFEGEVPTERRSDDEIEDALTSLPVNLLGNNTIHDAMHYNWAVAGQPLASWARCKAGTSSLTAEAAHLPFSELMSLIRLSLTR